MYWLIPAIAGYILKAASDAIDKILLEGRESSLHPVALTFYTSIAGLLVFIFAPFGFYFPTKLVFLLTLSAGIVSTIAFFFLYQSLARGEASRVITTIGAVIPVVTFVLAHLFLRERFSARETIGLLVVLLGVVIVGRHTYAHRDGGFLKMIAFAIFFSAVSAILIKAVYLRESFFNGLIWMRIGALIPALAVLFYKPWRDMVIVSSKQARTGHSLNFLFARLFSSVSGILVNFAILLGPVTLVVGLQGLEYVFLFLLVSFVSYKWPHILKEDISAVALTQKFLGIAVVITGVLLLSISLF